MLYLKLFALVIFALVIFMFTVIEVVILVLVITPGTDPDPPSELALYPDVAISLHCWLHCFFDLRG